MARAKMCAHGLLSTSIGFRSVVKAGVSIVCIRCELRGKKGWHLVAASIFVALESAAVIGCAYLRVVVSYILARAKIDPVCGKRCNSGNSIGGKGRPGGMVSGLKANALTQVFLGWCSSEMAILARAKMHANGFAPLVCVHGVLCLDAYVLVPVIAGLVIVCAG